MKQKPKTPYQRLLEEASDFARKVKFAHIRLMWFYAKERLGDSLSLDHLNERVQAADQLGYDVILRSTERGLEVLYRKQMPTPPWNWNV